MLAERETYESDEEVESSVTKEAISIGKININYEAIIANKTAQEKESLSRLPNELIIPIQFNGSTM